MNNCFLPNCCEKQLYNCSCSPQIRICKSHFGDHCIQSVGPHNIYLLDSDKSRIIEYYNKLKAYSKETKERCLNFSNKLISTIKKSSCSLIATLSKMEDKFKNICSQLRENKFISQDTLNNILNETNNTFEVLSLRTDDIENLIKTSLKLDYNESNEPLLFILNPKFTHLKLLNLNTNQVYNSQINPSVVLSSCCAVNLGKNKYFLYGGTSQNGQVGNARIINLSTDSVEHLPPGSPSQSLGGCLLEDSIYLFGGCQNNTPISNSFKFNLRSKSWHQIQYLPEPQYQTTAGSKDGKIYVIGHQSAYLLKYFPAQNAFASCYKFTERSWKFVFDDWIVVFEDFLYEIRSDEIIKTNHKIIYNGNGLLHSGWRKTSNKIYFLVHPRYLFIINTDSRTLSKCSLEF